MNATLDFPCSAFIKIVADTPAQIRRCDVYRLLNTVPIRHRSTLIDYLAFERPDLGTEVEECLQDIVQSND